MANKKETGSAFIIFLAWVGFFIAAYFVVDYFYHPLTYFAHSRDTQRKQDLQAVQKKLEQYYAIFGKYPKSDNKYQIIGLDAKSVPWGFAWHPFMDNLPQDTDKNRSYAYIATSDRQAYALYASLELGTTDKDACNKGQKCKNAPDNACGVDVVCNYGVTSANITP